MVLSVLRSFRLSTFPLGLVNVATSGTKVGLMSVVDPNSLYAPGTATPGTAGATEYSCRAQQIAFQACKSVAPFVDNTGAVYILVAPAGSGTGNKTDSGVIVHALQPGETFFLASAPLNVNVFSGYDFWLDADNSGDGVLACLIIQ